MVLKNREIIPNYYVIINTDGYEFNYIRIKIRKKFFTFILYILSCSFIYSSIEIIMLTFIIMFLAIYILAFLLKS
jgi:hypothetical protein